MTPSQKASGLWILVWFVGIGLIVMFPAYVLLNDDGPEVRIVEGRGHFQDMTNYNFSFGYTNVPEFYQQFRDDALTLHLCVKGAIRTNLAKHAFADVTAEAIEEAKDTAERVCNVKLTELYMSDEESNHGTD